MGELEKNRNIGNSFTSYRGQQDTKHENKKHQIHRSSLLKLTGYRFDGVCSVRLLDQENKLHQGHLVHRGKGWQKGPFLEGF